MSEKTIVYEGPEGAETARVEQLKYESSADCWQFERTSGEAIEIVRVPRERVYRISQQRAGRERTGRDEYGHP